MQRSDCKILDGGILQMSISHNSSVHIDGKETLTSLSYQFEIHPFHAISEPSGLSDATPHPASMGPWKLRKTHLHEGRHPGAIRVGRRPRVAGRNAFNTSLR